MVPERIRIGSVPVDVVDMNGALDRIVELVEAKQGGTVFTPNVDHVVVAEHDERFRNAYSRVSLSLVDGMPVLWASRLLGRRLPEKVSGSDLVRPLMQRAAERGYRVFLFGGGQGVAELAAQRLAEEFSGIQVVGTDASKVSLADPPEARAPIARRIAATRPDLVLVCLGAPKQEVFCDQHFRELAPAVMVCIGAGIDFIAGTAQRAPRWVSRSGLEWLYRLVQEPRRLAGRYLLRDPQFVAILARQMIADR